MPRKSGHELAVQRTAEAPELYGKALANRQRAVLEDIFEKVKDNPAYRKAAEAQFIADPLGSAERLHKLYGPKENDKGANPLMNIGSLYLQAIQGMTPAAPAVQELELVASGTTRVQEPASDW